MRTILYRRWAPAKSAVKIEFPPDIIHDIRAQALGQHDRGYLFGRREGQEVRITTAIRTPQADDPRVQGTEAVGVFIIRARGEVFLTDADLEQIDRVPGGVALVIAGARAGFFTRELDGTMQAVRSHEEFLVAAAATEAEHSAPLQRIPAPPPNSWKWAAGLALLLAGPVAALAFLQPVLQPPVELALRESNGQLVIQWDPSLTTEPGAFLEITEPQGRTLLPIAPYSGSATYSARTGDVEILLSTQTHTGQTRTGRIHWTSPRFTPPIEPTPVAEFHSADQIQEDMAQLESQATYLRQAIARRRAKVVELSAEADKLLGPVQ